MSKQRVLFVLTGHDRLGKAGDEQADKTGFHLSEAATPWKVLTEAGFDVDFATPEGGRAPIDPGSLDRDDKTNVAFLADAKVKNLINNAPALRAIDLTLYDALYFPGGHGTMWDLPDSEDVQNAARTMWEDDKVVAAVCHGPAALVNVKLSNGSWLVDGKTLSVFTDSEERAVEKDSVVPFLLGSKLKSRGATLESADDFDASVSVDGRLITGQNPASAQGVGEAVRDAIKQRMSDAA